MTHPVPATMLQLRSMIRASGELEISLAEVTVPQPGPDEVLVKVIGFDRGKIKLSRREALDADPAEVEGGYRK